MKISQLLTEDEDSLESYIKKVHALCKERSCNKSFKNFLNRHVLTHTTHRDISKTSQHDLGIMNIKVRSKPTSTPLLFHNIYDELYKEKFDFPYRSASLFTYPAIIRGIQQKQKETMLYILPPDNAHYAAGGLANRNDFFSRLANVSSKSVAQFVDYLIDNNIIAYDYETEGQVKEKVSPLLFAYVGIGSEEELIETIKEKVKDFFDFTKYSDTYKKICLEPIYEFMKKDIATVREYNDFAEIDPGDQPEIMIQAKQCVFIQQTEIVILIKKYARETDKSIEEIFEDMKKWIK